MPSVVCVNNKTCVNGRLVIRCPEQDPTPYLRSNWKSLTKIPNGNVDRAAIGYMKVLDIGCGNGRNSRFMQEQGFRHVTSLDMAGDYGQKVLLGVDPLPIVTDSMDIILCNYLLMFLNQRERNFLIDEIKRVARWKATIMVELYAAKESHAPTQEKLLKMQSQIFNRLGWRKIKYSQERFIAQNHR